MTYNRLLLGRPFEGMGDSVMFQTLLSSINRQYPDLAIDLDTFQMSPFQIYFTTLFDNKVNFVKNPNYDEYELVVNNCIYHFPCPKDKDTGEDIHLIDSMHQYASIPFQLELIWDGRPAKYKGPIVKLDLPQKYVLMPSRGRPLSMDKEWGEENFQKVCDELSKHVAVVQIGNNKDPLVNYSYCDPILKSAQRRFYGVSPIEMHALLNNSSVIISLENGLSHFGGLLEKKTVTLYTNLNRSMPVHAGYVNQHPIIGSNIDPYEVIDKVLSLLD